MSVGDPATVVIDAVKDLQGAANAMKLYPQATSKQFTPTVNPAYAYTDPLQTSPNYQVPATYPHSGTQTLTSEHTATSSWSIGGSVDEETTVSFLRMVNASVKVGVTASHQWTDSHTDTQAVAVTVDPGYEGWIESQISQVTLTGDCTFTAANGTNYKITNVTITQPGDLPTVADRSPPSSTPLSPRNCPPAMPSRSPNPESCPCQRDCAHDLR